ncbi:hypothetical protein ACFFRR_009718 [Megaselia abdita]
MFPNVSQIVKTNSTNTQNQQSGSFNQQQNSHNYNWGALAAHSAFAAAAGYSAPTLMPGHSHQNASTNQSGVHQPSTSSQSTTSTPYHQFSSRNLPFTGYDYNYRSGGY